MCDKCRPHAKYWIHIADQWTEKEKQEMLQYLETVLGKPEGGVCK